MITVDVDASVLTDDKHVTLHPPINIDYSEHPTMYRLMWEFRISGREPCQITTVKFKKEERPPNLGSMPGISERTSLGESEFSDLPRLPTESPPVLRGIMTSFHLQNLEPNVVLIALSS